MMSLTIRSLSKVKKMYINLQSNELNITTTAIFSRKLNMVIKVV